MESASVLPGLSRREALRPGQERVVQAALDKRNGVLSVQLPTGYGKTRAAVETFCALRDSGEVNRLLYLVPTDPQRTQFCTDGEQDFADAGAFGVHPFDLAARPVQGLKEHRHDKSHVFVATIQSVVSGNLNQVVKELMQTGRWMVAVDEYHHYGVGKAWGKAVLGLNYQFMLAMSATPWRPNSDGAFPAPSVVQTYIDAWEERNAVKKLILHAYEYRVDAVSVNGQVVTFTTSDLLKEVGSPEPEAIDRYVTGRKLRWSPKYISPLVTIPIERLAHRRGETGLPLQMIVGAMGCLHAQMVVEQAKLIASAFGTLRVDWVGTGPNGRTDDENKRILRAFCPPKRKDGQRHPEEIELDILIHVGMAGEGLDSVYVAEVVHLNPANLTNQNHQENGRAARWIPHCDVRHQVAYINVDSSSPFAPWTGTRVMELFDAAENAAPSEEEPVENDGWEPGEYRELPDEPQVFIAHCELTNIDKGDPEVRQWATHIGEVGHFDGLAILDNPTHPLHERFWAEVKERRRQELLARAQGLDRMSTLAQLQDDLNRAVGKVAYLAVRTTLVGNARFEKSLIGDMKRRISTAMVRAFGSPVGEADEEGLRKRRAWVKGIEQSLLRNEIPLWLA